MTMQYSRRSFVTTLALAPLAGLLAGCSVTPTGSSNGSATPGQSALLTTIKQRGKIIIGSSNDAPFAYKDEQTGKLAGIDIEILTEINKRLGIDAIELKVVDFANLLIELNNNTIDMVVDGMYVKPERLQTAAFSDKWYQEGEAIVIPVGSAIAAKTDLKGKKLGAQPGTAFFETAQKWQQDGSVAEVVSFDNQANLMTAVNMGKVDAVITDGIVAGYTLSKDSSLKLKLLENYTPEASGQIGSAVRFGDKDFLAELNGALNAMKQDGTLLKILTGFGLNAKFFVDAEAGKTSNVK